MPDRKWVAAKLGEVRRALHSIGDIGRNISIALDQRLVPIIATDMQATAPRNDSERWATLAGSITLRRPYSSPHFDPFWLNYFAGHCAAALSPRRRDPRCDNCKEFRGCSKRDKCILRYFRNIKARDLKTQDSVIIKAESRLRSLSIYQWTALFYAAAVDYRNKGRDYRRRPGPMTLKAWLTRTWRQFIP